MYKPQTWLNSGETGALPITTMDLSRIEYGACGAVGKEVNIQYLMTRNTYNISNDSTGWVGGAYSGSSNGTVSSDTSHYLTGTSAIRCYVDSNLGGMKLAKTMDLNLFESGLVSDEDDYIRFSVYLDEDSLGKLGSLAIMFRTALDVSTNYMWYYVDDSYFSEGWSHIWIRKGEFIQVGTFDWSNVTGVSFFTYPTGADEITFTIECLELCRNGIQDDDFTRSMGNCLQNMGTQGTSIKYGLNTTNLLMNTYSRTGETRNESSKIWVGYSGVEACLKFISTGQKTTGEFQLCEDFFMEDNCVFEIRFKPLGTISNRYRIGNLQFWQSDKHSYIEFYVDSGSLTCYATINGIYSKINTNSFSIVSGHYYTMKIYRDKNNYTCIIYDEASSGIVGCVGGFLETKEYETWASEDYYSYAHSNTFRPFFEIRSATNGYLGDVVLGIKTYKV